MTDIIYTIVFLQNALDITKKQTNKTKKNLKIKTKTKETIK